MIVGMMVVKLKEDKSININIQLLHAKLYDILI